MTNKNEVGFHIKRTGRTKFEDTKPEQGFKAFAESLGFIITKAQPVTVDGWTLTGDFDMKLGAQTEIIILIDGRYHFTDTQERKDRWRDQLYQKAGKKVIHIDAGLTLRRWWPYLKGKFFKALTNKERVTYIHE